MGQRRRRRVVLVAFLLAGFTVFGISPQPAVGDTPPRCDVDGDGRAEVIVGAPGIDEPSAGFAAHAGAVVVLSGGDAGLTGSGAVGLHQDTPRVPDRREKGDRFGAAVACGDIDGDGFSDVVVGVPGESVNRKPRAGAIHVFYGSSGGLDGERHQRWSTRHRRLDGRAVRDASFGAALAVADFDGDGYDDAVVGAPGTATVYVLHGAARGLTARHQRVRGARFGEADRLWRFGSALAADDFDGDGELDLAIGSPGAGGVGAVAVLYTARGTLGAKGDRLIDFATPGIRGRPKAGAGLGTALAAGDLDADGIADLAIGAPGYRYAGAAEAGVVLVVHGSSRGLRARDVLLTPADANPRTRYGFALATGDHDGDGVTDLAVGAPTGRGGSAYTGRVDIRAGGAAGLVQRRTLVGSALGDRFGSSVAADDHDGDGIDDLAIGAPGAATGTARAAGAVIVASGGSRGARVTGRIDRATPGVPGAAAAAEAFAAVDGSAGEVDAPAGSITIEPRSTWTDRDPDTSLLEPHEIETITIHHAGGTLTPQGPAKYRSWQSWHMDGRGWGDIAYHFIVGRDGTVYEARDTSYAGDTGTSYDPSGHLLFVLEGNFEQEHPTQEQLDTLVTLTAWAKERWNVSLEGVGGHRDHAPDTLCPGGNLYPVIASGELHERVQALLDVGGVWAVGAAP